MRKSAIHGFTAKLKTALLSFMIALLVVVSLPFNLMGGAAAEAVTATTPENGVGGGIRPSAAGVDVEVTVNYYRPNGDYTGYNVWIWETNTGGDGAKYDHDFEAETVDFDGYAGKMWKTMTVTVHNVDLSASNAIGVIIRKSTATNDWAEQTGDLNILSSAINNNKVSVFIVQGADSLYYTVEDAMAIKFKEAYFSTFNAVYFSTTQAIPETSVFVIRDSNDEECGRLEMNAESKLVGTRSGTVTLSADFDFAETYTLSDEADPFNKEVNFGPIEVSKTSLYDTDEFKEMYDYDGALGVEYSAAKSIFRVWSPTASNIALNVYDSGEADDLTSTTTPMVKGEKGVWEATVTGDLAGKYYTYSVTMGAVTNEIVDPYARSGGRNGLRGMILDLATTNPDDWNDSTKHNIPDYGTTANAISKAVIYEAQLRDLTIHESSGVTAANRGKFLGLTETGTKNSKEQATALDYLKELGVTQVHFQPLFDFASVNEDFNVATYNKLGEYNWGYDPLNYNMPEGSYSSDPSNGAVRVNEMKQMIMALHNAGIQVVMDVVYNHVSSAPSSNFEALVPGYYFRMTSTGSFYNGSGCGNETASERAMFRKFMIDSVKYWTEEYKIDGFRFDLMGCHDIETMNMLYDAVAEINPDVIIYGEGWTGGTSGLLASKAAVIANANKMPNIAVFDDIIRDGLKGGVFEVESTKSPSGRGFMTGLKNMEPAVYVGAAGGTNALNATKYNAIDKKAFASNPTQNINYVSAHDNSTLWDKMNVSLPEGTTKEDVMAMYRMAAASVLTSQGASFFLAGEEMMRSKPTPATYDAETGRYSNTEYDNRPYAYRTDPTYTFSDNSYKSPDSVNAIDWEKRDDNSAMVDFYKGMIEIKKTFPQLHMTTRNQLRDNVFFVDEDFGDGIAQYLVREPNTENYMVVIFNTNSEPVDVSVPNGDYSVIVNGAQASAQGLSDFSGKKFTVGALSTVILVGELEGKALYDFDKATFADYKPASEPSDPDDGNLGLALGLGIGIPAAVLIAGGVVFGVMYGKKKKNKGEGAKEEQGSAGGEGDGDGEPENGEPQAEPEAAEEEPKSELDDASSTPTEE